MHIQHLCPSFSFILIHTYYVNLALYIESSTLLWEKNTTQKDLLAMPLYDLGALRFIDCISGDHEHMQMMVQLVEIYLSFDFGETS